MKTYSVIDCVNPERNRLRVKGDIVIMSALTMKINVSGFEVVTDYSKTNIPHVENRVGRGKRVVMLKIVSNISSQSLSMSAAKAHECVSHTWVLTLRNNPLGPSVVKKQMKGEFLMIKASGRCMT